MLKLRVLLLSFAVFQITSRHLIQSLLHLDLPTCASHRTPIRTVPAHGGRWIFTEEAVMPPRRLNVILSHLEMPNAFSVVCRPAFARLSTSDSSSTAPSLQDRHVQVLFENARVRVSDFRLPVGGIATFQASYPTVRWQVDAARHALVENDSSEIVADVPDKHVFFLEAGTAWQLHNVGQGTYRHIIFELKQPPRHTEDEVREILLRARYSTDVGTKLLFENRFCRVWDFYLEAGEAAGTHHHVLDYVFVYVAPGRLLGYHHDGRPGLFDSVNEDNDVTWFDIPESAPEDLKYAHGGKNGYDDTAMREYLVELK